MKAAMSVALLAAFGCCGSVYGSTPGFPPVFVGTPYVVTVDVSDGQPHSFSFTGSAYDPDVGDTVQIIPGNLYPFMRYAMTPGNPASFTLSGAGLTRSYLGGQYVVQVGAIDVPENGLPTGTLVTVNVVPDPATSILSVAAPLFSALYRRRRMSAR